MPDEVIERARDFYAARAISNGWDATYDPQVASMMADFAQQEAQRERIAAEKEAGEKAVREFIQLYTRRVLESVKADNFSLTTGTVFRELYGEEL